MSQFSCKQMEDGQYRSTARDADGTFQEHGFGEDDTSASAALGIDLLSRALQAGSKSARERLVRKTLRMLEAWNTRNPA